MNTSDNEAWVERALTLLDQSADALDAATLSRLNRARQAALAQRHRATWPIWMGGGLGACALALVVAFGVAQRTPLQSPVAIDAASDADAVAADDNLDLYENLDFYAWLDAQQQDGDG